MKLYRAQQELPELSNPTVEAELSALEKERDSGPPGEYMVDAFERMGKEKYVRLVELRATVKEPQFFVRTASISRFLAGTHRYLIELDIPESEAENYLVLPDEVRVSGGRPDEDDNNYAFTGQDLGNNRQAWQVKITDVDLDQEVE